jgi:ABC-type transport system involved in multi-copper enzyme maturation permease subunit
MRRELAIAFRARATWIVLAVTALLVGHGFVLAIDVFSTASRSALAAALQAKEMDPLVGVVRPTLGAVDLALILLGPILAARVLAVEKERGTFGALCLQLGSTNRVVFQKLLAAGCATSVMLVPAILCLGLYRALGGHLGMGETAVAFAGEALHLGIVVAASIAAAAWTRTSAQAATVAILIAMSSWLVDAGEGFAALAWLGTMEAWSIERHVAPFQHGIVAIGPGLWLVAATVLGVLMALVGASLDRTPRRRALIAAALTVAAGIVLAGASRVRIAYDATEQRRASLPPDVVTALRSFAEPIALEVGLDRDDSRRRQLESDVLAKLLLARSDLRVAFPLDTRANEGDYGRIVVRVGSSIRETRSTSRKEIVTLVLEAAGARAADWTMAPYSGYPLVVEGAARNAAAFFAYGIFPLAFLGAGLALSRRRNGR